MYLTFLVNKKGGYRMILEGLMTDLGWILFAVALIFGFLGGSALIYFLPIIKQIEL